jgi:hypothetical protein
MSRQEITYKGEFLKVKESLNMSFITRDCPDSLVWRTPRGGVCLWCYSIPDVVFCLFLCRLGWCESVIHDPGRKATIESYSKPFCPVSAPIPEVLNLEKLVAALTDGRDAFVSPFISLKGGF